MALIKTYPAGWQARGLALAKSAGGREATPHVVHAVGALTDPLSRFLCPAVASLDLSGVRQHVLIMNAGSRHDLIERLPSRVPVLLSKGQAGLWRRCKRWTAAYHGIQGLEVIDALHVYGIVPSMLLSVIGGAGRARRVVYSAPTCWDASGLSVWKKASEQLALYTVQFFGASVICSDRVARGSATGLRNDRVTVIDPPLDAAFLPTEGASATGPLVIAGASGGWRKASTALAQVAVLGGHGTLGAPVFQWSGECDEPSAQVLAAAGIARHRDHEPAQRAARLARAWVFASPGPDCGFPWHIAEAMACGIPVVALDTPINRELVVDGVTGFLCGTAKDMFVQILALIDRPHLRRTIGLTARNVILGSFNQEAFTRRLLDAFGFERTEGVHEHLASPQEERCVG